MPRPQNAMEIFQLLDKSNCRDCGEKTCLAFAGAVFKGLRTLDMCPKLDAETVLNYSEKSNEPDGNAQYGEEYIHSLKDGIRRLDFSEAAERTGGRTENNRLVIKILGKNFSADREGRLSSEIHVNPWVAVPFYNYVLHGKGRNPTGKWCSFRELKDGKERYPLFQKRCEEALKRVADVYTDLFDDMVHIFGGKETEKAFASDISVILYPLPKLPLMVCYWMPEDGLDSTLNLFFDETADENLDIGSLFSLGAGLAQMFEKLSLRHGTERDTD